MIKESLAIILLLCSITASAQTLTLSKRNNTQESYKILEKNQIDCLYREYRLKINYSYILANGKIHYPYYYRSELKPVLFFNKKHSSSITINGEKYEGIDLDYDTFTDEIIYIDRTRFYFDKPYEISLNKNNVDSFEFLFLNDTLLFKRFDKKSFKNFDLQDGFYEEVYNGKSKYLINHKSTEHEHNGIKEYYYSPLNYVNVGNGFEKFRSKRQFVKLFGDKSEEIKNFMKRSRISMRKADKKQITRVLKYYDNLTSRSK